MKHTLLIITALMLVVGFTSGQEPIDGSTLVWKDGLMYAPGSEVPYSGEMVYYDNGQKEQEATYKDGKEDGLSSSWWENGQKKSEVTFKDGKEDGFFTYWYENGQKEYEGTYIWMSSQYSDLKRFTKSSKRWDQDGKITMENGWVY